MMAQDNSVFAPQVLSDETRDGIRHISVIPSTLVCSSRIDVTLEGDIIREVSYTRGCAGNTQGVAALASGMTASEAARRLRGIDCHGRGTSCPDQLARVLEYAIGG